MKGYHMGRNWTGHQMEDECPCPQAPCGLILVEEAVRDCGQHAPLAAKTMRQIHDAEQCPAAAEARLSAGTKPVPPSL